MTDAWAGIEAGGTKFVCAVGTGPNDIRAEATFPTTKPEETLGRVAEFFRNQQRSYRLIAVGLSCFGPLDLDPNSHKYGHITTTPKPYWADVDVLGRITQSLGIPGNIDTDVNGAALGEYTWGAAKGLDTFLYITVGTGVGGGMMVNGQLLHGLVHPEMGHIFIRHDWERDNYNGCCPFHGDCFQGLASGPAIEGRWAKKPQSLPPDHQAWELEAHYLALGFASYICILSPKRIVVGGGVMDHPNMFPMVRRKVLENLNNYVRSAEVLDHIDDFIVPPALGKRSGVLGAIALAMKKTPE